MSSDYDGQDQAYQDLIDENDALLVSLVTARLENEQLLEHIRNIAVHIYFQEHPKHQDRWLKVVTDEGIVSFDEDGDDE